jgi:hypothetical protein
LHTGSIPVVALRVERACRADPSLQADISAVDKSDMKRPPDPRVETRRTVRHGERTIDVRVITYPGRKRRP